jgi:hypothetical protein
MRALWLLLGAGAVAAGGHCPEKCVCRSSTVDCSNRGLTQFPEHVPRDTVKLSVPPPLLLLIAPDRQ